MATSKIPKVSRFYVLRGVYDTSESPAVVKIPSNAPRCSTGNYPAMGRSDQRGGIGMFYYNSPYNKFVASGILTGSIENGDNVVIGYPIS